LKNFHSSAAVAAEVFPKKSAAAAAQPLGLHLYIYSSTYICGVITVSFSFSFICKDKNAVNQLLHRC
jgi:hypothetical protein